MQFDCFLSFTLIFSEIQQVNNEWMNDTVRTTPSRRNSVSRDSYIPTADIIKKSISRSWTISSKFHTQIYKYTFLN